MEEKLCLQPSRYFVVSRYHSKLNGSRLEFIRIWLNSKQQLIHWSNNSPFLCVSLSFLFTYFLTVDAIFSSYYITFKPTLANVENLHGPSMAKTDSLQLVEIQDNYCIYVCNVIYSFCFVLFY